MTQQDVAERGGPSIATTRAIEAHRGGQLSSRTIMALERALGWAPGSVDDVLSGLDPTIAERSTVEDSMATRIADLRARMVEADRALADFERLSSRAPAIGLRVDPEVWDEAKKLAGIEQRTVGEIVKDAVRLYTDVMGEPRG